jgi:hypothetical protein
MEMISQYWSGRAVLRFNGTPCGRNEEFTKQDVESGKAESHQRHMQKPWPRQSRPLKRRSSNSKPKIPKRRDLMMSQAMANRDSQVQKG